VEFSDKIDHNHPNDSTDGIAALHHALNALSRDK
jgi:hypothetical protein